MLQSLFLMCLAVYSTDISGICLYLQSNIILTLNTLWSYVNIVYFGWTFFSGVIFCCIRGYMFLVICWLYLMAWGSLHSLVRLEWWIHHVSKIIIKSIKTLRNFISTTISATHTAPWCLKMGSKWNIWKAPYQKHFILF